MIHAIYMRAKPKNRWHLFSIATSPESANKEMDKCKEQAIFDGNPNAEVTVKLFDSKFWIPEYLSEIKKEVPLYN